MKSLLERAMEQPNTAIVSFTVLPAQTRTVFISTRKLTLQTAFLAIKWHPMTSISTNSLIPEMVRFGTQFITALCIDDAFARRIQKRMDKAYLLLPQSSNLPTNSSLLFVSTLPNGSRAANLQSLFSNLASLKHQPICSLIVGIATSLRNDHLFIRLRHFCQRLILNLLLLVSLRWLLPLPPVVSQSV